MAVELPSRANECHLCALEPTGGDFELVVKLRLVVIQPALWRFARKEVCYGFHPCPIIKRGISESQCKRFERRIGHGSGQLGSAVGDVASCRRRFHFHIERSTDCVMQALDKFRISRANLVQCSAQAGGQFVWRLKPVSADGWEAACFRQGSENKFHRLTAVEKRTSDGHGSSRKVIRLAAVFGNFPADKDSQRTHEINQICLGSIARVDFKQAKQFGKNISTDPTQLAVLE